MKRILMTTALVLPLSAGFALAQEEAAEDAAQEAQQAAEEAGDAAGSAAEAVGEAGEEAAQETGDEMQEAGQEMEQAGEEMEQSAEGEGEQAASGGASESISQEQGANELRIDWLTGATVMSPDGESIGDINDLIIDSESGQLTAAVVGVGGFLGIGEKQIAMSWNSLQIDYDANEVTSDITQQEAEEAPEYVFRDQESAPSATGGTGGGTMDGGTGMGGTTGGTGMGGTAGGGTAGGTATD